MMLKGQRVLLRAATRDDMAVQWKAENDVEMFFWDGGTPRPLSMEQLLHFHDQAQNNVDSNSISFAIETDGKYIGHCGLHGFDRVARTCELGIEISNRDYWGQGYGREVVRLLLRYAFDHQHVNRVWLNTHSENERAIRCYRACGFVEEGRLRQHLWIAGHYADRVVMGILSDELRFEDDHQP
jgi:RimJ/RimL family protein N-acetyltransferase